MMNPWNEITYEPTEAFPDGQLTCEMPRDSEEVEVLLINGEIKPAFFEVYSSEDWWFNPMDENGDVLDENPFPYEEIKAWRYPARAPDMLESGEVK